MFVKRWFGRLRPVWPPPVLCSVFFKGLPAAVTAATAQGGGEAEPALVHRCVPFGFVLDRGHGVGSSSVLNPHTRDVSPEQGTAGWLVDTILRGRGGGGCVCLKSPDFGKSGGSPWEVTSFGWVGGWVGGRGVPPPYYSSRAFILSRCLVVSWQGR